LLRKNESFGICLGIKWIIPSRRGEKDTGGGEKKAKGHEWMIKGTSQPNNCPDGKKKKGGGYTEKKKSEW